MYDVIVIGARCGGSPAAMLLARQGFRVLLVEKSSLPSDTVSTHYIHQSGVARLLRWNLLDLIDASGAPVIERAAWNFDGFSLVGCAPAVDGVTVAYAPRRYVLDAVLADAAVKAGVELRTGFAVKELVFEDDRVVGVRGRSSGGVTVTERARLVVGADGFRSLVAQQAHAPAYNERPSLTCNYYTYWSHVKVDGAAIYARDGFGAAVVPTNNDLTLVGMIWPAARADEVRADVEGSYMRTLAQIPELADHVLAGTREERFAGLAECPNFFRRPFGPGWALVGDAGYNKDPITAQGISDALRDAEVLARAAAEWLSGDREFDAALGEYERERNDAATPSYDWTCFLAAMEPIAPDIRNLLLALRDDQEQLDRFLGLTSGVVTPAEFFAPDNIARILNASEEAHVES